MCLENAPNITPAEAGCMHASTIVQVLVSLCKS